MANVELNYVLACDQVIVDINGKVSFIGVFNRINSKVNAPVVHGRFTITTNTRGVPGTHHTEKIEIVNLLDNKSITSVEGELNFEKAGMNYFFGNFINTLFPVFGKYWIKVSIDNEIITDPDKNYVLVEKNI